MTRNLYKTVAVPRAAYEKLDQLAKLDKRSLARELEWLIEEAHSQLLSAPHKPSRQ